jgi:hypothetical protein
MTSRSRFSHAVALRKTSVNRMRGSVSLKTSSRLGHRPAVDHPGFEGTEIQGFRLNG